jgi:hypothetical protein
MPRLEAQIPTDRASRFLVQFCRHAAAMGAGGHGRRMHAHGAAGGREVQVTAERSDRGGGTVTFAPWGVCTLRASADTLTIRIDGDDDGLARIRDVVTRDFARFSQRAPLTVTWTRADDPEPAENDIGARHKPR